MIQPSASFPWVDHQPELPFLTRHYSILIGVNMACEHPLFTEGPCSTEGHCLLSVIYRGVYPAHACIDHDRMHRPIRVDRPVPPPVPGRFPLTLVVERNRENLTEWCVFRGLY